MHAPMATGFAASAAAFTAAPEVSAAVGATGMVNPTNGVVLNNLNPGGVTTV